MARDPRGLELGFEDEQRRDEHGGNPRKDAGKTGQDFGWLLGMTKSEFPSLPSWPSTVSEKSWAGIADDYASMYNEFITYE